MQDLSVSGYSTQEVKAALHASRRELAFEYELLTLDNISQGLLDGVEGCVISHNALANIKRTAKLHLKDTEEINWLTDRIRPWFKLKMPDGGWAKWPLGIFLLSSPSRSIRSYGVVREIEAYDQGVIIRDDKAIDRYTIDEGANVIDAVKTILENAGVTTFAMEASAETLPTPKDWAPGTNWNLVINELLESIGYQTLSFNSGGAAVAAPYRVPNERPIGYTYATDGQSVLIPEITHELDLFDIANRWVMVVSEPDRPPLISTYTNDLEDSPTSTVSRGRVIVDFREGQDATSQAALDIQVLRLAFEASQVYEAVEFETGLMPHHEDAELLVIEYEGAISSSRFVEHTWDMSLEAGGKMKHRARRVVNV